MELGDRGLRRKSDLGSPTRAFNGPLSGTTPVSRYQKGKTVWILLK